MHNSRTFYKKKRFFFQKLFQPKILGIKDKVGCVTSRPNRVSKGGKKYIRDLLNGEQHTINKKMVVMKRRESKIMIILTIKTFKNDKAAGEHSIPTELIIKWTEEVITYLHKLITNVRKTKNTIGIDRSSYCAYSEDMR